ncbi:bifunctional diguanylate cyclase/phosphodiesterase [Neorhizobium sp. P12A]|uniref:putative bifunctional diguanylate cyclase/phosphodiesterase n=1 Tax=Neorhizobium sp. P12A TaxID=2268027 RepID=UPI0011ED577B|nr:bifunctional diguanylate cyclase/phosphodiesterase [Neorhizobium sp. P12A]KAA0698177.1 bifunctional diguanylate cyclase/phosphodiesterase [Neorhizobium sp. P12A]
MPDAEALLREQYRRAVKKDGSLDQQRLLDMIVDTYREQRTEIVRTDDAILAIHLQNISLKEELANTSSNLSRQNAIIEAIVHNLPLGLSVFDANQRLAVCNARFRDLFGFSNKDVEVGTPIATLLSRVPGIEHTTGQPMPTRPVKRLPRGTKLRRREWQMHDGRSIESIVTILPDGGSVSIHEDVTDERRAAERIAYIAHHDPLTGLPNRIKFGEEVEQALGRLGPGERLALVHLNLDRFKLVNNTVGLSIGDDILQQVAERLRSSAGSRNILARLGSDEFAILQVGRQQPLNVTALAEQISRELATPFIVGDKQVELSISSGIAIGPEDGAETHILMKNASVALAHAKADGGRRSRFFTGEMEAQIQVRHALEADLRHAVKNEEFELHYQPLYDVARARISGFEALLRWNHPDRGRISPMEFIPLAEEMGLIADIGRWVLLQACRDAAKWPGDIKVAVNVSAIQFRNGDLPGDVMAAIAAANLSPSRLELEITESVLMENRDQTLPTLHDLKARGIRISMDDFGTGYSSLGYLRSFPFDKIKIDKSFVNDIIDNREAQEIMHVIILLGNALGMRVTVEGVETKSQFDRLRREGCDEIQGYFISPPKPAADVPVLLAAPLASL